MYFNNIHIGIYLVLGLLGCIVGQISGMLNERFADHKKIFSKDTLRYLKINFEPHYIIMTITALMYLVTLYIVGIDLKNWYANIDLISYIIIIPMLISVFIIDIKHEIIPNRIVINMLEVGMISAFANGVFNPNGTSIAFDRLTGMLVGGGIFLIITFIGGLIAGKEAMGMGDVKFVGVLRITFWYKEYYYNISTFILNRCNNKYINYFI